MRDSNPPPPKTLLPQRSTGYFASQSKSERPCLQYLHAETGFAAAVCKESMIMETITVEQMEPWAWQMRLRTSCNTLSWERHATEKPRAIQCTCAKQCAAHSTEMPALARGQQRGLGGGPTPKAAVVGPEHARQSRAAAWHTEHAVADAVAAPLRVRGHVS